VSSFPDHDVAQSIDAYFANAGAECVPLSDRRYITMKTIAVKYGYENESEKCV